MCGRISNMRSNAIAAAREVVENLYKLRKPKDTAEQQANKERVRHLLENNKFIYAVRQPIS